MPTLFFMPWTAMKGPRQIGPISLVPYKRGSEPGTLGLTSQGTLDAIVGNYANRAFVQDKDSTAPVEHSTILRWPGDDERVAQLTDEEVQERLQQTQLLVFAAISKRTYGWFLEYCNADGLLVTAQHFVEDNPASTAVHTRRRDGSGLNLMSGTRGKPVFLRPLHVSERYTFDLEDGFALALLNVPSGPFRNKIMDAVTMFIRANTDANEVPESAEIVFMRAALDTLVDAGHKALDLKQKLMALMEPHLGPPEWHDEHIPAAKWQARWNKAIRPFEAWIEDFCHWRNEGAHGTGGGQKYPPAVWSLRNHLMFTSWFTSRIVKCLLAANALYTLTQEDKNELRMTELFFTYDISAENEEHHQYWHTVLGHVQSLKLENLIRESIKNWPEGSVYREESAEPPAP
ncbi:hypothetical protein [Variovorax sp. KK3]|uniref:hypothetical protein n=1 Tax=Variovorax sp. KK3 TaxID=1855728 RepID=UPI00097CBA37|nr:hypothetical protein [Variovorax sp. KK3]